SAGPRAGTAYPEKPTGYVTLNTLIFPGELEEAARTIAACASSGVDALLVQDIGIAWLANEMAPGLPIHASTQMTLTSAESVAGVEALGIHFERLVAAREMSRRELARMREGTAKEVEVFVHGAICVAYSGQCLTSEALGGRSANRGLCAQACRLPYDLVVDGADRELGDLQYLLSPKDLAAWEDVGDLTHTGIVSFKIEGRYKSPQYVAATVQAYRQAVEKVVGGSDLTMPADTREKLELTFSRGLTGGYIHEINHQEVVDGSFSKKRGPFLGRVVRAGGRRVVVELVAPLKAGDGVVFARPDENDEEGGRVYLLSRDGTRIKEWSPGVDGDESAALELEFMPNQINTARIMAGQAVHKTSDPRLESELAASYAGDAIRHQRAVDMMVTGRVGDPLLLVLRDNDGVSVEVRDTEPAGEATSRPLNREVLEKQLGRLGNTPFHLGHLDIQLEGELMVPFSRLNDLRRRGVEKLIEARRRRGMGRQVDPTTLGRLLAAIPGAQAPRGTSTLSALCRTLDQVEAAVASGMVGTIYTDFEDIRLHKEARAIIPRDRITFAPATIRIVKPGEAGFVKILLKAEPDAILLRNLASWEILRHVAPDLPMLGDFSLNVSNQLTAHLHHRAGIRQLVPSYDLNMDQLADLLRASPPEWYEITIHQYMPMFHMEHCVFCRFMSDGTDYTNCGRPCEKHAVSLRDRVGTEHPLKADAGCRNTVYNGIAQSASEYLSTMLDLGARSFRVDFLNEPAERVHETLAAYRDVLDGRREGRELWRHLRAHSKLGVTRGSMDHE
ncbi:MAG: U32 family peptidase, partial [Candidatus Sumerlaeia bacterium]|nr:U32 family peptidase [Candidatus Sumerlaeia bacterium]